MNVVIDTNVFISAVFWPGDSRECFSLWAKRRFGLAITPKIFAEYEAIARRTARKYPRVNPEPWLQWIKEKARVYPPVSIAKPLSRDADDDAFVACALASSAKIIISKDDDLLVLGKPFGVEIMTPRRFLSRYSRS